MRLKELKMSLVNTYYKYTEKTVYFFVSLE